MRRKTNKQIRIAFLIIIVFVLTLGYAFLTQTLNINGSSGINNATWNIYWDNLQVTEGSVTASTPTIDTNKTTVTFSINLSKPGDFYEFTVDAKNDGSVDAMIESISSKLNNVEITTIPSYLDYKITYSDDIEIAENQLLRANSTEVYKIRVEYKKDISTSDLPQTDQSLNFSYSVTYIQANENAENINHPQPLINIIGSSAVLDNIRSTYVTSNSGINFANISSDTNGKGVYIRAGTENNTNPIYYFRGAVDNNNVLFANFCWKIVRTTDTGGIKLIYNGVPSDGKCNNTGKNAQLSSQYYYANYNHYGSIIDVGYMKGNRNEGEFVRVSGSTTNIVFGRGYTNSEGTITLTDTYTTTGSWSDEYTSIGNHHYNSSGSMLFYVYSVNQYGYYYILIPKTTTDITSVINGMATNSPNTSNSAAKSGVDSWYSTNMSGYTSMLEDTIWCNDRRIYSLGGWDINNDVYNSGDLLFSPYNRLSETHVPDITCPNKNDSFTITESSSGNGKLTYPAGLITTDEAVLAGSNNSTQNKSFYLYTGSSYWTMSPYYYGTNVSRVYQVSNSGNIDYNIVNYSAGIRPLVSLKAGTKISNGAGTANNPYIVLE